MLIFDYTIQKHPAVIIKDPADRYGSHLGFLVNIDPQMETGVVYSMRGIIYVEEHVDIDPNGICTITEDTWFPQVKNSN